MCVPVYMYAGEEHTCSIQVPVEGRIHVSGHDLLQEGPSSPSWPGSQIVAVSQKSWVLHLTKSIVLLASSLSNPTAEQQNA